MKKSTRLFLSLLPMRLSLLLFLWAVLWSTVQAQPYINGQSRILTSPVRIVVIGSSTAAGAGARPIDSAWVNRYRSYLKRLHPRCEVVNLAKGGYQTFHLLPDNYHTPEGFPAPDPERNISRALALRPDAIIVNLPSNDAAAGYGAETQLRNLEVIAHSAWTADVPIWFVSVQPRNFDSTKVQVQLKVLDAMSKRFADRLIPVWAPLATPEGTLDPRWDAGDGIHLNNHGHAVLLEQVIAQGIPLQLARGNSLYAMEKYWRNIVPPTDNALRPQVIRPLPPTGLLLRAEQPMSQVNVAVFDANGKLLRQFTADLPYVMPADFGPPGVYRVRMRKGTWERSLRWVKM